MEYSRVLEIAPRKFGCAEIKHDTPTSFDRLRGKLHGQPLERDTYCRLLINGSVVMTDAEFERSTNMLPVIRAKGDALIAGLGIGLILEPFLKQCTSVTVIEKEPDVIELVGKNFYESTIIHADIFEWLPARKAKLFDTIYFDIWPNICMDDLREARTLHKKFRPYLRKGGYMESWCRIACFYR